MHKRFLNYLGSAVLLALSPAAIAATINWSGAGANDFWSNPANWSGGTPSAANGVMFDDTDATGSSGSFGGPNNIVDASVSIQTLRYGNTNGFHTTQIPLGMTLSVTGSVSPVLYVGTGTDNGNATKVYATVNGPGSLLVTNNAGAIIVIQGSGTSSGDKRATLDLQGLDTFTAFVSQLRIGAENGGSGSPALNRGAGTVFLAKTNHLYLGSAAGTPGVYLGRNTGNDGRSELFLGLTNAIFSDAGITIGGRKSTSGTKLAFDSFYAPSVAWFRNRAGTGRQADWIVGDQLAQTSGSTGTSGEIDLSTGTVDALVNTITIGRGTGATGTGVGTGTLTFGAGIIDANTIDIGVQPAGGGAGVGTLTVNAQGRLVVNNAIRLTPNGGASSATLNVPGGRVLANSITNGGGATAAITLSGGTLVITNQAGTPESPILTLTVGDSRIGLTVTAGITNIFVTTLDCFSTTTNNTIDVLSLPTITGYPAQFPVLSYAGYSPAMPPVDFVLGQRPSTYVGFISNNVANNTLDVVITGGPAPSRALVWNGNINGDWNTVTANWRHNANSSTYNQGDLVSFDDTAIGVTSVSLSAGLAPLSLVVSNINKPYSFTGAGNLTGAFGMVKAGSGTLTLSNTGENSFAGGVSILDGTIQLSGAANRLPTNAVVSLADVPAAALNLNGVSQTIAGLTGGGASGGNVALGSANLTVTGPGIFDGQISGGGSLTKSGTGTLTLNAANTYTAGTLVEGGTLVFANNSASSPLRVETNSVLQLGAGTQLPALTATSITNNGTVRLDVTSDSILTTPVSGGGGLTKVGTGMITVPGANTYTGVTTIAVGPLRISHPAALGAADGDTTIANDATARLELAGGITVPEPLRISQKQSAAGAVPCVVNISGSNTLSGSMIATTGGSFWTFQVDTDELVISGPFTNAATSNTRVLRLRGPAGVGDWRSAIVNQAANLSLTGVTKEETGTWILGGNNTYTGPTVVSDGTLLVNGSIAGGTVAVNGGVLGGVGTISAPVTVNGSGTLSPGVSIGKLTVPNTLTLLGRTVMEVSRSGATVTNDQVAGITTLSLGGDLEVKLVGTLTGGEVFKLFTAATITGGFANVYLPDLTAPLAWDTTRLAVDGTLLVTGGTPQPPTLVAAQTNNVLTFSWQGTGFRLQAQTNSLGSGLGSNWANYPGGNLSPVTVTIDPAKPTVFFRLISE